MTERSYLEDVISGFDVRYIDPLTVNVMAVQIPTSHRDSLFTKVGAFIPLTDHYRESETLPVSFSTTTQAKIIYTHTHTQETIQLYR